MDDKQLEDKLDKIIRVVTRTEVQVEALMHADAHTRLTKLETTQKNGKWLVGICMAVPTIVFSALRYFKV